MDDKLQLILHDEVRMLLDHFASVLGVRIVFLDAGGATLLRGRGLGNCRYCELFQRYAGGVSRCEALDRARCDEVRRIGQVTHYRCHAGLHEAAAPIARAGTVLGFVILGQFRMTRELPAELAALPESARNEAARNFRTLPLIPEERLAGVLGLFRMLIEYITARELVAARAEPPTGPARSYIARHFAKPLRLADAARANFCSASTLAHALAREHTSFKALLLEARLAHAESLWRANPRLTVGEVAGACGFADRYYFSRLYRAKRGRTPGEFRKTC